MIKNGKYYVRPEQGSRNFKELFARLASAGAGRPVDKDGCPDGPWTPENLADAISNIEGNRNGIELRTVQVWFQDNDNGVSHKNIRWLARIFGCDDPDSVGQWQAELTAAKTRLTNERRAKRKIASQPQSNPIEYGSLAIASVELKPSAELRSKEAKSKLTFMERTITLAGWKKFMLRYSPRNLSSCGSRVFSKLKEKVLIKKSKYSDTQIIAILKQAEGGVPVSDLCREHGMSSASFYEWRSKYGGMDASLMARMKELDEENKRLKTMYAEKSMQNDLLKEALGKK